MTRRLTFACAMAALMLLAGFRASPAEAVGNATPAPVQQTAPPDIAAPSPTPEPPLFSGQIIDLERGYVVFASGDALRLAPNVTIVDDASGVAPSYAIDPGIYAAVTLDSNTALVVSLRTSRRPLSSGLPVAQVPRQYVIAASQIKPNPDIAPPAIEYMSVLSKAVGVTITVEVPSETPYSDSVYMATDTSGWNPQAVRMQRLDGIHFRIEMELSPGTQIYYLFTRGTWNSVERDRAALQRKTRTLTVPGGDVRVIEATVYRWADQP